MFSGIVETTSRICRVRERQGVVEVVLEKPSAFEQLNEGDSIALDGVCLTLERFDDRELYFALGPETLQVTGWTLANVQARAVNVERSLRLGDRIHGHLVTGHVDARTEVVEAQRQGETLKLSVAIPQALRAYIWPKGSVALNGVSLTVNHVNAAMFQVWLIPETLKRTNLGDLVTGSKVNLEIDNMARGLVHVVELAKERQA